MEPATHSYMYPPLQTYMAHCVYMEDREVELFKSKGVGVVHCPNSNFRSVCINSVMCYYKYTLGYHACMCAMITSVV